MQIFTFPWDQGAEQKRWFPVITAIPVGAPQQWQPLERRQANNKTLFWMLLVHRNQHYFPFLCLFQKLCGSLNGCGTAIPFTCKNSGFQKIFLDVYFHFAWFIKLLLVGFGKPFSSHQPLLNNIQQCNGGKLWIKCYSNDNMHCLHQCYKLFLWSQRKKFSVFLKT